MAHMETDTVQVGANPRDGAATLDHRTSTHKKAAQEHQPNCENKGDSQKRKYSQGVHYSGAEQKEIA
jgi:hypothetical protein